MFRKFFVAVPLVALAIGGSTACATKKFVRTSVGEVNEKVDSQGRAIEETQERTRKNEGRIGEVDSKAQAAAQSAQAVAINQDGTLNGPANPAARGSVVTVWGTGYGQTDPPCQSGGLNLPSPYAVPLSPGISALIYYVDPNLSGVQELATVQYAGSAPTLVCGIVQIRFQVPVNVAPGAFSFSPAIGKNGTIQALTSATIAVK